ncbi:MAG: arylsulfatase [Gemmatimonadetes bacterium]|nr:arylsulfatase [Gemmatimonadota bacterium]MDA1103380.1 arylsulfatase [Gemmatimonadota bacterium]
MTSRLLISVLSLVVVACTTETPPPPNIIYMLADDLGYGELGSYGQTKIRTPNLDALATEGVRFTQHYSGSPVCAPSRGTLMTGLHTGHGQIRDNFEVGGYPDPDELGQMPLDSGTYTLGRMLQDAGYVTAAIGKWGLGGRGTIGEPHHQGFDYFFGYLDQQLAHNYYPTHLWRNGERVELDNEYFHPHQRFAGDDPNDPGAYAAYQGNEYSLDVMADDALRFLDEHRDVPFFLYLPFAVPHLALQVPDSSLVEYEGAFDEEPYLGDRSYLPHPRPLSAYAGMITRMDAHIGRILERLDELGLAENTIVMFSSDNGATYTGGVDASYFDSSAGLRGLKGSVYEGGVRVPLIARWPGRIAANTTSEHPSAFWDLMPTLADVVGVSAPPGLDGVSFLPALLGSPVQVEHEAMYWEYHGLWNGAQAVRMGDWKGVRLGGHDDPDASIELYDLRLDIAETTDVSADHPDVVARIRQVMQARTESSFPGWNFAR